MVLGYLVIAVISYLIGSIPCGLIIGKLLGIDLRKYGSKNIGATNAYRTLGVWPAFWVFLGDALKGVAGVYIGAFILDTPFALLVGGLAAIIGHNWPVYLGFKGGRGVATSLGVIAVITPWTTLIVFLVWLVIVYFTRYVSLASIIAAALVPILMWIFGEQTEIILFGILAALFVIVRHHPNIKRLLRGEESKIKAGNIKKFRR